MEYHPLRDYITQLQSITITSLAFVREVRSAAVLFAANSQRRAKPVVESFELIDRLKFPGASFILGGVCRAMAPAFTIAIPLNGHSIVQLYYGTPTSLQPIEFSWTCYEYNVATRSPRSYCQDDEMAIKSLQMPSWWSGSSQWWPATHLYFTCWRILASKSLHN